MTDIKLLPHTATYQYISNIEDKYLQEISIPNISSSYEKGKFYYIKIKINNNKSNNFYFTYNNYTYYKFYLVRIQNNLLYLSPVLEKGKKMNKTFIRPLHPKAIEYSYEITLYNNVYYFQQVKTIIDQKNVPEVLGDIINKYLY